MSADEGHRIRDVVVDGASVGERGSHIFSDIRSDHAISAEFTATHRVTFRDRGAVLSEQAVDDGAAAKAPDAPNRKGYTFTGWDAGFSNVKSDIEVNAVWRANSYRVRFDADGGTGEMANQAMTYDEPEGLDSCTFSRPGHQFRGWALEPSGAMAWRS